MLIFNQLDTKESSFSKSFNAYLAERNEVSGEVSKLVSEIILKIRSKGDNALKDLTKQFDGFDSDVFKISTQEINKILKSCDKDIFKSLEYSFEKILNYQSRCFASLNLEDTDNEVTRKFRIIESVGIYVPGGKASYPSTVLMGAAPALACGVSDISITSPSQNGILNTLTIAAAKVAGIETIYRIGGAQAIAALAIGTDQISKVDKIIGPGNIFVAEAKKQLFGEVGIDSIAGPSEILILADSSSNPETIAWDLMAQSEHDSDACGILISDSETIIAKVKEIILTEIDSLERCSIIKESITSNGLIIKIDNFSEAKQLVNKIAPEHLHLAFDHVNYRDENSLIAGLILKGENSANSFSDYVLGPSHILPTNSSSRFSSPLSVEDFIVSYSFIELDREKNIKKFNEYIDHTSKMAKAEGLTAHAIAAEKRFKN
ncbi:MAG: histidinol dehydrogenase [Pseudomonadota bacterium]|nr:histidinol dehydrogenase [Pseudomonadota bacterium]